MSLDASALNRRDSSRRAPRPRPGRAGHSPRAILASALGWALVGCLHSLCGQQPPPAAPAPVPQPYTRVHRPDTNRIELQIALRRFDPPQAGAPKIWLVAVSHIGEAAYYQSLQRFLDQQSLVLYEGVGDPQQWKQRSARNRSRADAQESDADDGETTSLQSALARSLGLAFQLDAVDYDRPHFKNSDLSMERLQSLLLREMQEGGQDGAPTEAGGGHAAFLALLQAMDGSSWLGATLHMAVKLLGSSPKLQAMSRLMFIDILGQLQGDLTQLQGLPSDVKELIHVLIRERNSVVIDQLRSTVHQPSPPASIAVFYGAGHMDDLEKRIRTEFQYHPAQDEWMSAIIVQPSKAGLSPTEIQMIRAAVKWQMQSLQQSLSQPKSTPRPATAAQEK